MAWTTEGGTELAGLADHGDRQVPDGALDLAVNVLGGTPGWLREALAEVPLEAYPDPAPATAAAAARHGVDPDRCLPVNGAAEAFWALAFGLRPRLAACVHPSFTAPEAALRAAGVPVVRVVRRAEEGFALDPARVPAEADLVVLGRPDNPTGTLPGLDVLAALARPGRLVVVDEAFADFLPDGGDVTAELGGAASGLVCVRSLTKLWGLAGLRVGYVLGPPAVLAAMAAARQPWPVSSPALRAVELLSAADGERRVRAGLVAAARAELATALEELAGRLPLRCWLSGANFALLRTPLPDLRARLLDRGIAVRRGETFPGLDSRYVRVAVPVDPPVRTRLVRELTAALARWSTRSGPRR